MADIDVAARWTGTGLDFVASGRAGRELLIDGDTQAAVSPVETLAIALATCMAADIIDITGKMRLQVGSLDVKASGMRNPEPPRRYLSLRVEFAVGGVSDEDAPKLERALELSREKYCSVLHTLRQDVDVEFALVRTAGTPEMAGGA
ncbi:MAG TPA: OsmC family protein [Longimicrobiales bacterium]